MWLLCHNLKSSAHYSVSFHLLLYAAVPSLYLFSLCKALLFATDYMSGANRQEPKQLSGETGAHFAQRLRLMAKQLEERNGHRTVDSDYLRMKAAIIGTPWLFKEQLRITDKPPATRKDG